MLVQGSVLEDRYRIEKRIGKGGSSTVYEAVQIRTGRRLAVKEIHRSLSGGYPAESLQLLKNLRHPGLPMILDVLETEENCLIVMEYIEGSTLQQELESRKCRGCPFQLQEVLQIGEGLCEILVYLHSRPEPLLYRDLKPGNIILRKDGRIALVDLETVCRISAGEEQLFSAGSPGFAAPEQYRREPL